MEEQKTPQYMVSLSGIPSEIKSRIMSYGRIPGQPYKTSGSISFSFILDKEDIGDNIVDWVKTSPEVTANATALAANEFDAQPTKVVKFLMKYISSNFRADTPLNILDVHVDLEDQPGIDEND